MGDRATPCHEGFGHHKEQDVVLGAAGATEVFNKEVAWLESCVLQSSHPAQAVESEERFPGTELGASGRDDSVTKMKPWMRLAGCGD